MEEYACIATILASLDSKQIFNSEYVDLCSSIQ